MLVKMNKKIHSKYKLFLLFSLAPYTRNLLVFLILIFDAPKVALKYAKCKIFLNNTQKRSTCKKQGGPSMSLNET